MTWTTIGDFGKLRTMTTAIQHHQLPTIRSFRRSDPPSIEGSNQTIGPKKPAVSGKQVSSVRASLTYLATCRTSEPREFEPRAEGCGSVTIDLSDTSRDTQGGEPYGRHSIRIQRMKTPFLSSNSIPGQHMCGLKRFDRPLKSCGMTLAFKRVERGYSRALNPSLALKNSETTPWRRWSNKVESGGQYRVHRDNIGLEHHTPRMLCICCRVRNR